MFQLLAIIALTGQILVYAPKSEDGTHVTVAFDTVEACEQYKTSEKFLADIAGLHAAITAQLGQDSEVIATCDKIEATEEGSPH